MEFCKEIKKEGRAIIVRARMREKYSPLGSRRKRDSEEEGDLVWNPIYSFVGSCTLQESFLRNIRVGVGG